MRFQRECHYIYFIGSWRVDMPFAPFAWLRSDSSNPPGLCDRQLFLQLTRGPNIAFHLLSRLGEPSRELWAEQLVMRVSSTVAHDHGAKGLVDT